MNNKSITVASSEGVNTLLEKYMELQMMANEQRHVAIAPESRAFPLVHT